MAAVIPIKRLYQRLVVRVVKHPRVYYRPLIITSETRVPDFSYEILEDLLKIISENSWMVDGSDTYRDAMNMLEQQVQARKEPVLDGFFISVWPTTKDILVRDLKIVKKAS